MANAND